MKQKGKTWYTSKGEETLARYIPPYEITCERIGQKIAGAAESLEKEISQVKYDLVKQCHEVYLEYLKTHEPVSRFSFTTFDRAYRVEFDTQEGYVRVYRATKKEPGHKDYQIIVLDLSTANPLNLPKTEEEKEKRLEERETVIPVPGQGEGAKQPISEKEAWTMTQVKSLGIFLASDENDKAEFARLFKIANQDAPKDSKWNDVTGYAEDKNPLDYAISQRGDYFVIVDCGVSTLYKRKEIVATKVDLCACGKKSSDDCLEYCIQLGQDKLDKMTSPNG